MISDSKRDAAEFCNISGEKEKRKVLGSVFSISTKSRGFIISSIRSGPVSNAEPVVLFLQIQEGEKEEFNFIIINFCTNEL
jgi:hypothetical protein